MIEILNNSWIMAIPFFVLGVLSVLVHMNEGKDIDFGGVATCAVISLILGLVDYFLVDVWQTSLILSLVINTVFMGIFYRMNEQDDQTNQGNQP